MQFLKTLFWVVLAIILVLFARNNWESVTLNLWGGLQADVKKPVLIFLSFLVGFLPTLIAYRARIWSLRRRYEPVERVVAPPAPPRPPAPSRSVPPSARPDADTKAWPAS